MKEGFWVGLLLGVILTGLVILFLFFGGNPRGVLNRLDDLEYATVEMDNYVQGLNNRIEYLETHRHYGK